MFGAEVVLNMTVVCSTLFVLEKSAHKKGFPETCSHMIFVPKKSAREMFSHVICLKEKCLEIGISRELLSHVYLFLEKRAHN